MVAESWFRDLWKIPWKHDSGSDKAVIGVLAFEVASLMSKLIHLWLSLSDKQVARLTKDISNSEGIKKLVSEDDDYIVRLIYAEFFETMVHVAKSVARLGNKCSDLTLKSFEHAFDELIKLGTDPYGWEFSYGKMDKKVKKMEHFISINATLYQEMEMFADLEQTMNRMKGNDLERDNLPKFQKKLVRKKQEVKHLREISLWNRTYDYAVRLLVRSLFTIFSRMNHVFGFNLLVSSEHSKNVSSDHITRSQSVSALMLSVNSSKSSIPRFSSGPLDGFGANWGTTSKSNKTSHFYSGPLNGPTSKSGPISGKNRNINSFSGPLGNPTTMSGPISGINKISKKLWQNPQSPAFQGTKVRSKPNRFTQVGPFKGCTAAPNGSPFANCYFSSTIVHAGIVNEGKDKKCSDYFCPGSIAHSAPSVLSSGLKLLDALPETLGAASLALHYANVIVVIEKLAASPHLIGHDARDDLYNMLPLKVRNAVRAKLKRYPKSLALSDYDTALAGQFTDAMPSILEWLAPLAHSMIRWHTDKNFEQQNFFSRTNVLLVQTLYFANQEKTEAAITELLVGLNYVWRITRELNTKTLQECAGGLAFDEYVEPP